jgi:hypothetical protein
MFKGSRNFPNRAVFSQRRATKTVIAAQSSSHSLCNAGTHGARQWFRANALKEILTRLQCPLRAMQVNMFFSSVLFLAI